MADNSGTVMQALADQDATLTQIQQRLSENSDALSSIQRATNGVLDALPLQWLRDLGSAIKSLMQRIFFVNVATYQTVLSLQSKLPTPAERSTAYFQEPFILEDALGRIAPVHMQFISTWAMFDAVLQLRFEGLPGLDKVKRRQFVLEDRATRTEIHRHRPLDLTFLPGQRVDMSVVFISTEERDMYGPWHSSVTCPRCQWLPEKSQSDSDVHW